MGRYDKIKVYNNGSWHTPSRIRVYNNGWQDLGTSTSDNTKTMKVRSGSSFQRCTLNKRTQTVVTDRWAQGRFNLLPASGYCRCSKSSGAGNINWYFRAVIEKTTSAEQHIFYCGTGGSPESPGSNYVRVTWLGDGRIRVDTAYNSSVSTMYSSNSVGANQQVYLNVYSNAGSYACVIEFNGVVTSSNLYTAFRFNGCTTTVGSSNTKIRGTLSAAGCSYSDICSCSFDASTASGSNGYSYANVNHQESTRTDVWYE